MYFIQYFPRYENKMTKFFKWICFHTFSLYSIRLGCYDSHVALLNKDWMPIKRYLSPYGLNDSNNISLYIITLRPRQNGRHLADGIFKGIFFKENLWIWIKIFLKFVPNCLIGGRLALVQIRAWHQTGNCRPSVPIHICIIRSLMSYSNKKYHQTSNIRCPQSQNLNVSDLVLQLFLPNPLKLGVEWRMKM